MGPELSMGRRLMVVPRCHAKMGGGPGLFFVCVLLLGSDYAMAGERPPGTRKALPHKTVEPVYKSGISEGWNDYGWATRDLGAGHPARLDFSRKSGWIIAHPGLKGRFGGLRFRYRAPAGFGDFLEVRVASNEADDFPRIHVGPTHRIDSPDGWSEVWISMTELNPDAAAIDRVVFRGIRAVPSTQVELDDIGFTDSSGEPPVARAPTSVKDVSMRVDCSAPTHAIKPAIYGIGRYAVTDEKDVHQWQLGAAARRWGGNATTRFNWQLGNAWNTANDWYFRNVTVGPDSNYTYRSFLEDDLKHGVQTALTIPIMGWVAKDTDTPSFPLSEYPSQRNIDPTRGDAGDGVTRDGKPIQPGPATRTSVPTSAAMMGKWVAAIRQQDAVRHQRSVQMYILDNEPMLWSSTHRDVHPERVGYDELLEKTVSYASAIRKADPDAVIAGPAEWGWPAYFYSDVDSAAGFRLHPDRRAHGDVPLLAWYLRKLKEHQDQTGERLLDVVDLHFYSQGKSLAIGTAGGTDRDTNARRLRSTRSLWDPTYVDESWIGEAIELIPRMRRLIRENYPGRGISIGEYNFGAENHITGGLALAEALGRFGQQDIDAAFYWYYPAKDSHAFWAFRAYRNFDGRGGRFQDLSVPTQAPSGTSLFASKDAAGSRVVLVAINMEPSTAVRATIDISTCGRVARQRTFVETGDSTGLVEATPPTPGNGTLASVMPPYSFSVIDLTIEPEKAH
jgi:hypothetical protein